MAPDRAAHRGRAGDGRGGSLIGTMVWKRLLRSGEGKKMHLWHEMFEGERLLATGEHFLLHVSLETRRPSEPSQDIIDAMASVAAGQADLPAPDGAGRHVGQRK